MKRLVIIILFVNGSCNTVENNLPSSEESVSSEDETINYGQFGFFMDERSENKVYEIIKLCKFGCMDNEAASSATDTRSHYITFSIIFIKKFTIKENETSEQFEKRKDSEIECKRKIIKEIYDKKSVDLSEGREFLPMGVIRFIDHPDINLLIIPYTFVYKCTNDVIDEVKRLYQEMTNLIQDESINDLDLMIVANTADRNYNPSIYHFHYANFLISAKNCLLFIVNYSSAIDSYIILKNKYLSVASDDPKTFFQTHMNNVAIDLSFLNGDSEYEKGFENVVFSFSEFSFNASP